MPEFNYLGVNSKGKTLSGNVVADSLKEARQNLRSNGLTPLKLELSDSDSLVPVSYTHLTLPTNREV